MGVDVIKNSNSLAWILNIAYYFFRFHNISLFSEVK